VTSITAHDGIRLNIAVHDYTDPWRKAPVLILQHGFSRSGRFWYNMVPYLARFYRIVCPDLRGLGESSRDFDLAKGISVENYIADVISVADGVGAEDFHYAGESLGGIIGMAMAAKHPARVRTLSLLAAPLVISEWTQRAFAFGHPTWQDALRTLGARGWSAAANTGTRFPAGTDPAFMTWYADETGKSDTDVLIAMSRVAAKVNAEPALEHIKAPVLALNPSGGKILTPEQEATMRAKVANLRIVNLPIQFHMVWALAPATCADHMLHFMALHDGISCREP